MTGRRRAVRMISFVILIGILRPALPASATQKRAPERELRVAGIMFDFDLALRKNPVQAKPSPKAKQQGGPVKEFSSERN